jgi:hypothetical protein
VARRGACADFAHIHPSFAASIRKSPPTPGRNTILDISSVAAPRCLSDFMALRRNENEVEVSI